MTNSLKPQSNKLYLVFCFLVILNSGCKKNTDNGSNPPIVNPPGSTEKTFKNPLLNNAPDPYVIKKDTTYYYSSTLGNRIGIWKTTAMSKLSSAPLKTVYAPVSGPDSKNLWAPEFYFINSKWYMYYTAGNGEDSTQRLWVLENSNPDPTAGTWTSKGRIYNPGADMWSIDGTILELNGSQYLLWSGRPDLNFQNQNIYIAKMSDPWTLEGAATLLTRPELSWETNGNVNEGPEILKNPQGKIFLIYSASGCWTDEYGLGMLSLKDNGDPLNASDWTKSQTPVFMKSNSTNVYGPGHNSFFKSKDGTEDWIIYHANPMPEGGNGCGSTRSTRMQKFTWNADGIPNFGTPVSTSTALKVPSGE